MTKNWLIRTKSRQLLGPVSREKIIEFVEKGALTDDDELTTGNGYWFWVKERDLIDRYLYNGEKQTFNPISEAPDVLTSASVEDNASENALTTGTTVVKLPSDDDLAFPDMGDMGMAAGAASASGASVSAATSKASKGEVIEAQVEAEPGVEGMLPSDDDLAFPDMDEMEPVSSAPPSAPDLALEPALETAGEDTDPGIPMQAPVHLNDVTVDDSDEYEEEDEDEYDEDEDDEDEDDEDEDDEDEDDEDEDDEDLPIQEMKVPGRQRKKRREVNYNPKRNDRYLFYILFIVVALIGGMIFYYKKVLNQPLPIIGMSEIIFPSANAQTAPDASLRKKKV